MSQVILITGASSGIGKAVAEFLAAKGHRVYGTSRSSAVSGGSVIMVQMDITNNASVQKAIQLILDREGRIDVLVNNAGMGMGGALESFTDEELHFQMDTSFSGLHRVIRAVLPAMRQQQSGKIINVSSIGGLIGLPFQGMYSAAKFAIEGYSEALAMELKPWKIKVVMVNPGDFKTGFTHNRIITKADAEGGIYAAKVSNAVAIMGKDEQSGCNPHLISKIMNRIVESKHPDYRYIVGRFDQRLIARIRHLLPPAVIRWIIADHYKIN